MNFYIYKYLLKNYDIKSFISSIFIIAAMLFFAMARDCYLDDRNDDIHIYIDFIDNLKNSLEKQCYTLKNRDFLLALTTGKRDFPLDFRYALTVTGTMHIVAISAFHTGIMVLLFSFFFKTILFFCNWRQQTKKTVLVLLKLAASFYYFYITGASIPTLRALLFILVVDFFAIFGFYPHSLLIFFTSVALVSLIIPNSLLSMSFWMSAVCVATVLKIWRVLPKSSIISITCLSIAVNYVLLVTLPELSGSFPLSAPFVNLFVIPVVACVVPFVTLAQFFIPFSEFLAFFMLKTADFLIAPARFFIIFFADYSERVSLPLVQVPLLLKIFFALSFFTSLYFEKKVKYISLVINTALLPFFFFQLYGGEDFKRSQQFNDRAFCAKENFYSGRIFFDKYSKNPLFNSYFYSNIERFSAECGITKVLSVHFPGKISEKEKKTLRKKIRFKNAEFYSRE